MDKSGRLRFVLENIPQFIDFGLIVGNKYRRYDELSDFSVLRNRKATNRVVC